MKKTLFVLSLLTINFFYAGMVYSAEINPSEEELWGKVSTLNDQLERLIDNFRHPQNNNNQPMTEEYRSEFGKKKNNLMEALFESSSTFWAKYPDSIYYEKNVSLLCKTLLFISRNDTADEKIIFGVMDNILEDKKLPAISAVALCEAKFENLRSKLDHGGDYIPIIQEMEKSVLELIRRYPNEKDCVFMLMEVGREAEGKDKEYAKKIYREMGDLGNADTKRFAEGAIQRLEIHSKPISLKFTALDGRKVDLEKMRGKVVLIDFWSTQCGACVLEMPDIKKVYDNFHKKGFEIIGISMDDEKNKKDLVKLIKDKEISWPQFYDGKGIENEISSKYGISVEPTMWLVDKKGMVVNTDARPSYYLTERIEQLLNDLPVNGNSAIFKKEYMLDKAENVKFLHPKYNMDRLAFVLNDHIPNGYSGMPDSLLFQWDNHLIEKEISNNQQGFTIEEILNSLQIYPFTIQGDKDILRIRCVGDFVVRRDISYELALQELEKIFQGDLHLPVKFGFKDNQEKVIVIRGNYQPKLFPDRQNLCIYSEKPSPPKVWIEKGNFQQLTRGLENYLKERFINETQFSLTESLSWAYNYMENGEQRNTQKILQHLTEQTGLTFTEETRTVPVLFVEKTQ